MLQRELVLTNWCNSIATPNPFRVNFLRYLTPMKKAFRDCMKSLYGGAVTRRQLVDLIRCFAMGWLESRMAVQLEVTDSDFERYGRSAVP